MATLYSIALVLLGLGIIGYPLFPIRQKGKNHDNTEKVHKEENIILRQSGPYIVVDADMILSESWFRIWKFPDGTFTAIKCGKGQYFYGDVDIQKMNGDEFMSWIYKNLGGHWAIKLAEVEPQLKSLTYTEVR